MRDIKKEYMKYIVIYFLLYLLFLTVIVFRINVFLLFDNFVITNELCIKLISSVILIPICSLLSLVILNIIPTSLKNIFIFWKAKEALPSYRLNEVLRLDDRINLKKITKLYGKKLSPQEQHDNWYKYYKKNENDIRVINSQKNYLFSRDLCASTIVLFIVSNIVIMIGYFISDSSPLIFLFNVLVLMFFYIIFMVVARNSANRFVGNVLLAEYYKDNI